MSDEKLRKDLIKLAYNNEEVQDKILPLLKEGSMKTSEDGVEIDISIKKGYHGSGNWAVADHGWVRWKFKASIDLSGGIEKLKERLDNAEEQINDKIQQKFDDVVSTLDAAGWKEMNDPAPGAREYSTREPEPVEPAVGSVSAGSGYLMVKSSFAIRKIGLGPSRELADKPAKAKKMLLRKIWKQDLEPLPEPNPYQFMSSREFWSSGAVYLFKSPSYVLNSAKTKKDKGDKPDLKFQAEFTKTQDGEPLEVSTIIYIDAEGNGEVQAETDRSSLSRGMVNFKLPDPEKLEQNLDKTKEILAEKIEEAFRDAGVTRISTKF